LLIEENEIIMPSANQILSELNRITNESISIAILWHIYYAVIALLFVARVCRSIRLLGALLAMPVLSVGITAWIHGNPFNGSLFTLVWVVLMAIVLRLPRQAVEFGPAWMVITGVLLFLFAWFYPHFLNASSVWMYYYATPVGVIPCPTLSASIGGSLIFSALFSRAWILTLAVMGLFYGLFGALVLGVRLDFILAIGGFVALLASVYLNKGGSERQR
jgi:hypothetical protein